MRHVVRKVREGSWAIVGMMIKSFLEGGNQAIPKSRSVQRIGCWLADPGVAWDTIVTMAQNAAAAIREAGRTQGK